MLQEVSRKFGVSESSPISFQQLTQLQADAWDGNLCSEPLRPICWRLFFGCISTKSQNGWATDFEEISNNYLSLKQNVIPKTAEVKVDPLSALLMEKNEEWDSYYKV